MDKGAGWGEREVAKHRELAKRYPEGFCIELRVASGISDQDHVPIIHIYWEMCLSCSRDKPNPARCPDCASRQMHVEVDLEHMDVELMLLDELDELDEL